MKLRPLLASEFVTFNAKHQDILITYGGVPVNDKLIDLWDTSNDITLLYGSRGGGKSEGIADELLRECLEQNYFRGYYGRKVFDNVRHSQFDTLVSSIRKQKLEKEFSFSDSPNGSMDIIHVASGNMFIPFGSDKPEKLKSIKDPTHIWGEELDQFELNDFKTLFPTLRTKKGLNRFIGSFNSYEVMPDHWILKVFFPNLYQSTQKNDKADPELLKGKKVKKIFVNYQDNYFLDHETYRQTLWIASAGNLIIFNGLANGNFGVNLNETPYAYAFDKSRQVSDGKKIKHPVLDRKYELILSFDFNRNPMTCVVAQHIKDKGKVNVLEVIRLPNSGVDAVCEEILVKYPGCLYLVTGDYNGDNVSSLFEEQITHYEIIKSILNLTDLQIRIRPNPKQAKNSTHVNLVLYYYDICIHGLNAIPLIFDLERVKRRADGTIVKQDRDKPEQQADALDCLRYLFNEFLDGFQPSAEMIAKRPMMAESITQSVDQYQFSVRDSLLVKVQEHISKGNAKAAQTTLNEIKKLDEKFSLV